MKNKILEHYKSNFDSSPVELEDKEINFIIAHDCQCDYCGKSIFEMDDFPNLLIEDGDLMCEECYDEEYYATCPICEESYDTRNFTSDHIVIAEDLAKETGKEPGIYKILERPFFFGDIVFGFDSFFDGAIELVAPLKINHLKIIECGESCCEVTSDNICPDCEDKYIRKSNYLKANGKGIPCILIKRYENDSLFKNDTPEQLRKQRQWLIHKRITERGSQQEVSRPRRRYRAS